MGYGPTFADPLEAGVDWLVPEVAVVFISVGDEVGIVGHVVKLPG